MKHAVATAPKLAYPDYTKAFCIATDASNVGVGGVLYQPDERGGDITPHNIVALYSKKLSGSQLNYPAYKKELLAVVLCLREFRSYVWGQPDLIVFTDHRPLTHIFEQRELSPAVQQWLDVLLDFQFDIEYREGKLNVLPDHLSRLYAAEYEDGRLGCTESDAMEGHYCESLPTVGTAADVNAHGVVSTEEVVDDVDSSRGGGNAEALTNSDQLVDALIEMEKRGYTIPSSNTERKELIEREHALGHFGRDAVC